MIVAAILFSRIVIYQDNNLNVIKNDKDEPDFYALYLPRFIRVREDKTEADSHDKIVESLNAVDDVVKNIFEKEK